MSTSNQRTAAKLATSIIIAAFVLAAVCPNFVSVSALTTPRDQTVVASGYWPAPTSFNPLLLDSGQGWDQYLMYEPMFTLNVANNTLIKWLGQSVSWAPNGTQITVTLRSGIKWTDGNAITANDVKYTFFLLGGFNDTPAGMVGSPKMLDVISGFRDRVGPSTNFIVNSNSSFTVKIYPTYANSDVVYRTLTRGYLIVPAHVWTLIAASFSATNMTTQANGLKTFTNDWNPSSGTFTAAWKVASGMYLPYWTDHTVTTIMQRNDNWWGVAVFGRGPNPKYFEYTGFPDNPAVALALSAGNLDWDGNYIPNLNALIAANPNIVTYFNASPYFPDKSAKLLVFNQRKFPLSEPWLRQAIARVIDYTANNLASSNYLALLKSPLLIPKDDSVARVLLNSTIESIYQIKKNLTTAVAIMKQHCYQKDVSGIMRWYTKAGEIPTNTTRPSLYNDTAGHYYFPALLADDDPTTPGVNCLVNDFQLIDVNGWTDVDAIDIFVSAAISTLNITVSNFFPDFGTYVSMMDGNTFDLSHYVMHSGINSDLYQRYTQLFTGSYEGAWNHYGSYRNPTLTALINSLDTVPAGSAAQKAIANNIFAIVNADMPFVPLGGHPDWAIFNKQYWTNWPSSTGNAILACSPFSGSSQAAAAQAIIWALQKSAATSTSTSGIDMTLVLGVVIIIVVAVVAIAVVMMRRKGSK